MKISALRRTGFELEVVLGTLGDELIIDDEADLMDMASRANCQVVVKALARMVGCS